ncbi:RloB family protein [uncultured Corynebacterium sp.]|uniref:RloB family protein n=1 Tax=uncultured Corynebacterium sp. TaxID=159447 RepID=UPI0028D5FF76|nr:RloB family protein [uncultured Corynebacterium sp.]
MAKRSKGKNIKSRRRRGSGTRSTSKPILLFVQGECTEKDYFELLKDRLKLSSLTIKVESQSPENLIDRTKTTISRSKDAPPSAIYYVVDVDNTSDEQFRQAFKAAKKATNRKTEYHFVVSHESFEAWLLAHFEDIRNKNIPRTTMGKNLQGRKMLNGSNNKNVSDDFPVEDYEQAVGRVTHCAFDEVNRETTSTAMPHLITELIKLKPKPK